MKSQTIWNRAIIHGMSSRPQIPLSDSNKVCQCCFKPVQRQPVSLCANTKELEFLGFGIPIYFSFIRCCLILLIVSSFSYSTIELYRNIKYNDQLCQGVYNHTQEQHLITQFSMRHFSKQDQEQGDHNQVSDQGHHAQEHGHHQPQACHQWMIHIASTQTKIDSFEVILRVSSFILHILLLMYIRHNQERLYNYYDQKNCSLSDFSIIIKNIPQNKGTRPQIRKFLANFCPQQNIQKIIIYPDTSQVQVIEKQIKNKQNYLQEFQDQIRELQEEVQWLQKEYKSKVQTMKDLNKNNQLYADKAIVILSRQSVKMEVLDELKQNQSNYDEWKKCKIKEAADPQQIIWENMGVSDSSQRFRSLVSYVLSLLVLAVVTVLFALLLRQKTNILDEIIQKQKYNHKKRYTFGIILLVYGALIAVVLFNKLIMVNLFHKFTDFQRKRTSNVFQFSFCLKYCLGLFFTTAIMTLIVEDFMFSNFYSHPFGVIHMETIMFFLNSAFVPLFWAVNPVYLANLYKRSKMKKKEHVLYEQAKTVMQDPTYQVGKRYAEIMEIMWFTFLYYSIIPIGAICCCVGLCLYYWVDKYNLLRKSSMMIDVSGQLSRPTLKMLDITLFWRAVSDILFDTQMRDGYHWSSLVMLGIAILYILLPMTQIIEKISGQEFQLQKSYYSNVADRFTVNYFSDHILYSKLEEDKQRLANKYGLKLVRELISE